MKLRSRIEKILDHVFSGSNHIGKVYNNEATGQLLKLSKEYGKKELIKIIDEYKCDFNWDFEKGKPKKKSFVNIWELRKKLEE